VKIEIEASELRELMEAVIAIHEKGVNSVKMKSLNPPSNRVISPLVPAVPQVDPNVPVPPLKNPPATSPPPPEPEPPPTPTEPLGWIKSLDPRC